jgi:hypothetical protein
MKLSLHSIRYKSIENPTLAHFRHFWHFSSLLTPSPAYKASDIYVPIRHYICRESSTNQLFLCKTNPIFSAVGGLQMNVKSYNTADHENIANWTLGENKPNSNPIKPNLRKAKMDVNLYFIEDYRKKDDFSVRINKPNFRNGQNERKLNFNKGLQKKRFFAAQNTNPIQTQSKPVLSAVEWAKFRTLFTLTARPVRKKTLSFNGAGDYNGIFSQMSFFQRTPIERG